MAALEGVLVDLAHLREDVGQIGRELVEVGIVIHHEHAGEVVLRAGEQQVERRVRADEARAPRAAEARDGARHVEGLRVERDDGGA